MRVIKVLIVLIAICAIALYVKNSYIKTVAVQNVRSGNSEVEKKIDEKLANGQAFCYHG